MKRIALLSLAGLLGYLLFFWAFARVAPSAEWNFSLNRERAIEIAGRAAHFLDQDLTRASAVSAHLDEKIQYYRSQFPPAEGSHFVFPVSTSVQFLDTEGDKGAVVTLGSDGTILSIKKLVVAASETASDPQAPLSLDQTRPQAMQALEYVTGESRAAFSRELPPTVSAEAASFVWEIPGPPERAMTPRVEVTVGRDGLQSVGITPSFSEAFSSLYSKRDKGFEGFSFLLGLLAFLVVIAGLGFYFVGLLDHEIHHRTILSALAIIALLRLLLFLWGGGLDLDLIEAGVNRSALAGGLLEELFPFVFVALPVIAGLWGAGYLLSIRKEPAAVLTTDLMLRGRVANRQVGQSVAAGVAAGGLLAAIPYLMAASGLFGSVEVEAVSPGPWVSPAPSLAGLHFLSAGPLFGLIATFGFLLPAFHHLIRRVLLRRAAFLTMGTLLLALWPLKLSIIAALVSGVLMLILAGRLFQHFGLLGVVAMGAAAEVAVEAASLWLQPSTSLQSAGGMVVGFVSVIWASSLVLAFRGPSLEMEKEIQYRSDEARLAEGRREGERERLVAEFSVAQRAQEQMLPEHPPPLDGFDLSAVCRPAREVGGDLYDFVQLAGQRWGIVVADVSGKGVPAALYMTLTKGLLESVCADQHDAVKIVREMNRHIFECARRSVFVTLALAVIDLRQQTIDLVRAGHNPVIWYQQRQDRTVRVNPSGIGLGLAPDGLFQRSLSAETVRLEVGDSLFLFSDGIPEAMNALGEEYGEERLQRVIASTKDLTAGEARDRILEDVKVFVAETPAHDDITLVVARFNGNGSARVGKPGGPGPGPIYEETKLT